MLQQNISEQQNRRFLLLNARYKIDLFMYHFHWENIKINVHPKFLMPYTITIGLYTINYNGMCIPQ